MTPFANHQLELLRTLDAGVGPSLGTHGAPMASEAYGQWMSQLSGRGPGGPIGADYAAAYLAVLKSATFRSSVEGRHDCALALFDPLARGHAPIRALAVYARMRHLGTEDWAPVDDDGAERLVATVLGLRDDVVEPLAEGVADGMPPWLRKLVEGGLVGTCRNTRIEAMLAMDALASADAYGDIDDALRRAPVDAISDTSMMTLLRGSYRFRSRLREWLPFKERVAAEWGFRKAPVDKFLIGL